MRFGFTLLFSALLLTSAHASPRPRRGPTSQRFSAKRTRATPKPTSQRIIDADRTTQIQTALISKGYLTGSPTGVWNPETQEALRKLQSDNGWQTKLVPDSRAIIKLGLGPGSPSPEGAILSGSSASGSSMSADSNSALSTQ